MFDNLLDRFGEVAVRLGLLERTDLDDALQSHSAGSRKLGEHLVDLGHLKPHHTHLVLQAQTLARTLPSSLQDEALEYPCVFEDRHLRVEVSVLDGQILHLAFAGSLTDETDGAPLAELSRLTAVRVADLSGIGQINRGGAVALWFLLGSEGVVLTGMTGDVHAQLESVGALYVLPSAHTSEEAARQAAALQQERDHRTS